MASFKPTVITTKGKALQAKTVAGDTKTQFTKVQISESDYRSMSVADIEALTELSVVNQEVRVSSIKVINIASIQVKAAIDNVNVTSGYYIRAIGLCATDPDEGEILYSVTVVEDNDEEGKEKADWMPPYNGRSSCNIEFELITVVSNAANVILKIDPMVYALRSDLDALKAQIALPYKIASSSAAMIDHDTAYVYVGSEAGYTHGGWYYWDGTAWTLGGTGVDPTLAIAGVPADAKSVGQALTTKAPAIYASASGAVVSFDDGAGGMPLKSLVVTVLPAQAGTGTPSPDNIRPISGWTGCVLSRSGADTSEPDTRTVAFPASAGTVYGGTLDVTTGQLTVDRIGRTFTGASDENWTQYGEGANRYFRLFDYRGVPHASLARGCSHFANALIASGTTSVGYYATTGSGSPHTRLQFRPANIATDYPTIAAWRAWLAEQAAGGTPLTCWWRTAAPVAVYSLDPTPLRALPGSNRIWADCGDVAVSYPADTDLYVQSIIAPIETAVTENKETINEIQSSLPPTENLLPVALSFSKNGVTMATNDDFSITVSGTATDLTQLAIVSKASNRHLSKGDYTISGVTGGSSNTYGLYFFFKATENDQTSYVYVYTEPVTVHLPTSVHYWLGVIVKEGKTVNDTLYPMLERGITHDEYIPPTIAAPIITQTTPLITTKSAELSKALLSALVEWTPLADCSVNHKKNEKNIGIPYHANLHTIGRDVFVNRSPSTFASAVKNPASILYTRADLNGDPAYGSMCSSLTAWLLSRGRVRWSKELYENYIEKYDYRSPSSIEVGDVLIVWNAVDGGHTMCVCGIDLNPASGEVEYITVLEEVHPNTRLVRYTRAGFENKLKRYDIGKYPNTTIVDCKPIRYATDIITEYGNDTWYPVGSEVWCFVQDDAEKVYVLDKDTQQSAEVSLTSLPAKAVTVDSTNYTVYNLAGFLTQAHEYALTTDQALHTKANILMVDMGTFSFDSGQKKIVVTDASVAPGWAYIVGMSAQAGSGTTIQKNNDSVFEFDGNELDVAALYGNGGVPLYPYFKINAFYPTKYGQSVCYSQVFSAQS